MGTGHAKTSLRRAERHGGGGVAASRHVARGSARPLPNSALNALARKPSPGIAATQGWPTAAGSSQPAQEARRQQPVGDAERLRRLRIAADALRESVKDSKGFVEDQRKVNSDQWAVSFTSEVAGGAAEALKERPWLVLGMLFPGAQPLVAAAFAKHKLSLPEPGLWQRCDALLLQLDRELDGGVVSTAALTLRALSDEYARCVRSVSRYMSGIIGGAEVATGALKATAVASGVAVSVLSGGLATGVVASTGAAAAGAGAYTFMSELGTQHGEVVAGTRARGDYELGKAGKQALTEALATLAGAAVGGLISKYALSAFGKVLFARMGAAQRVSLANRLGVTDITIELLVARGPLWAKFSGFIVEFVSGAASAPIVAAVQAIASEPQKEHLDPEGLWTRVWDLVLKPGLINAFLQMLLRRTVPHASRPRPAEPHGPAHSKGAGSASAKRPAHREAALQAHEPVQATPSAAETSAGKKTKPIASERAGVAESPIETLAETAGAKAPKSAEKPTSGAAHSTLPNYSSAEWLARVDTPEFQAFASKALRGRLSETPAFQRLWQAAKQGLAQSDRGYARAMRRFWRSLARGRDDDARVAQAIFEKAGFELRKHGRAARLRITWDTTVDAVKLKAIELKNPELAESIRASAQAARRGRSPVNLQTQQCTVSLEHLVPRHPAKGSKLEQIAEKYPDRFLDEANLTFEQLYENMLMGNKSS